MEAAVEHLLQMELVQHLDLLEGLEQRPETIVQLVQLIAQVAIDEADACSHAHTTRQSESLVEVLDKALAECIHETNRRQN